MSDLFVEVAKQVPSLSVLGLIVWFFLRFLAQREEAERSSQERRDAQFLATIDGHQQAAKEAVHAMHANAVTLKSVEKSLDALSHQIEIQANKQ